MSNATGAHDPSVADYRATSPRFAQGGIRLHSIRMPASATSFFQTVVSRAM